MALRGCCGCDLRASSLAIGISFLVVTILYLIILAVTWSIYAHTKQTLYSLDVDPATLQSLTTYERILFLPQLVFILLSLIFNSLLIYGARRSSACAVLAWLVFYAIVFVITVLVSVGLLIACGILSAGYSRLRQQLDTAGPNDVTAPPGSDEWNAAQSREVALHHAYVITVMCGVLGGLGVPVSALLWYWYALVLAFLRELSGYGVTGAETGQGPQGGEVMLAELPRGEQG